MSWKGGRLRVFGAIEIDPAAWSKFFKRIG